MGKHPPSLIPTRRSLISKLKNPDDDKSWKEFFDTYAKLIYGVAVQAGLSDAEAQDVVQETVICVAKKIQGFHYDPAVGSFKGWLLTTTRWRITDQFRKRDQNARFKPFEKATARTATVERVPNPGPSDLEVLCEREWEKTVLDIALERVKAKVNPKHYQIFDLYVLKQWPTRKVAETLGITAGKVFLVKHRVSSLLNAELRRLEADGGL
jgi:RNA polymerase sigma-70 factor (ECF subfamily)